jgi:LacI family transcriptional regulator
MASLKRIAADVGVSYTLVSKVLSGRLSTTGVSERTRAAILKRARELEYTPNRLAVALKAGRKGSVGVFLHSHGSPGSEVNDRLLGGMVQGLEESGYRIWLRFFTTKEEFVEACDIRVRSEIDGLIVAGVSHPELAARFRELERGGVPVVTIFGENSPRSNFGATNACVDYTMQGYLPTKHLLDLGIGPLACLNVIENRTRGFKLAHRDAGVSVSAKLIVPVKGFGAEEGAAAARIIENLDVQGIVCQSDAQANGIINEFIRRGVNIPEKYKITGVDNSPIARNCIIPITSVTSEMRPAGMAAAKLLFRKIEGERVESESIMPRLEIRESTKVRAGKAKPRSSR